jgi:site-specific DNA-cytosine methylase
MNTVELFSGTGSFSKVMKSKGHKTFTVDFNNKFNPDLVTDLSHELQSKILIERLKIANCIWMSPPCTTFSMASGNTHWTRERAKN